MHFLDLILDLVHRFSHPGSLPNDVAYDLGLEVYGRLSVNELLQMLKNPTHLKKYMKKGLADQLFVHAQRKDIFKLTSRFTYFFNQGLLEFVLDFDSDEQLRRAYATFHNSKGNLMVELPLPTTPFYTLTENLSQQ